MKVTKQETLYHEDYGATLKHKCGKKDSNIVPSLFFSPFLGLLSFFMAFSLFYGLSLFYLTWDNALENEDHHTFMDLQLKARTRYDSIWMPPTVYRDMQWIKSDMYENYEGGLATNTMSTTWSCKEKYDNNDACHINGAMVFS